MSLVDYASSSDDENDAVPEQQQKQQQQQNQKPQNAPQIPQNEPSPSTAPPNTQSDQQPPRAPSPLPPPQLPSFEKLPDASMLLNSPSIPTSSGADHASLVAAAMASRKRDSGGPPSSSLPRGKVPRGSLPHFKNIPDTDGGMLVPPQLRGRSNIVTEDIGKLFVRKHTESSSQ